MILTNNLRNFQSIEMNQKNKENILGKFSNEFFAENPPLAELRFKKLRLKKITF